MDMLTATELRGISRLDFVENGFPAPEGADPDPLTLEIARAVAWIEWATGLLTGEIDAASSTAVMWNEAAQILTEQRVVHRTDDYLSALHNDVIDISVTGYSERRVALKDRAPRNMLTPIAELNDLLWSMMTDDKRDFWKEELSNENAPAEVVDYFVSASQDDDIAPW